MTQKTIQCRLVAPESTRRHLWALTAERNTPLINELIRQVVEHSDFEAWRQKGRHPADVVSKLCSGLKQSPHFSGQPPRFYASAEKAVNYIFKSWFKLQSRLQQQLSGKQKWLDILQSDDELAKSCDQSLEVIQQKAAQLLVKLEKALKQKPASQEQQINKAIRLELFRRYDSAKNYLDRCVSAYLLKNGCQVPNTPEEPEKFAKRRRKAEIQVQRLQDQVEGKIPKGRDLTGQAWLETLRLAAATVPQDNREHKQWQDCLLVNPREVPFPLIFETNEDLVWSLNKKGRLCVHFNGLSEHTFEIYCDQRQLPWFKRFLDDQTTKRTGKKQHSSALFALRSARLAWQERDSRGLPWNRHHLVLQCSVDVRLWSVEGTEEVRKEKATEIAQVLTRLSEKDSLSETQEAYARRLNSTLKKLSSPFNRPSQTLYQGKPHIIVGLSLGWDKPVTLAVWNANTQELLTYRSLRQLLGKDYNLFTRQRQQQQQQSHERHKAQRQGKGNQFGSSKLGQHIDRLLAKAVVAIAKQYNAGSIAVPKLDNIRELLQAEITARAEQQVPGYLEGQKRYTKQYKINIHQWSYGRLINQISSKAAQIGLVVEESKQPLSGNPQEKAKAVAIAAYESRQIVQ